MVNQDLHPRRLRSEHVNSSVKHCRIVTDRLRLWKEGVCDLVMELCCALHNFRVRLTPVAGNDLIGINSNTFTTISQRVRASVGA
jgi:hypothetical protein